jgi:hypothetical protein
MRGRIPQNLSLFDNDPSEEPGEVLRLNKSLLINALNQLKVADSTSTVRRSIADLKNQLCNSSDQHQTYTLDNNNVVEFTKDYLLGELDQIAESQTLERALYYVERFIKSVTEVRTSAINDINLNRWKEYEDIHTDSLWVVDRRDSSGVHTAGYWGNFIPQIPNQMMRRYTKKGEWVLDTFAGSGTTLIEGQRLGRNTIGIELKKEIAEQASRLITSEPNVYGVKSEVIVGDSATVDYQAILRRYGQKSVQLVVMHPPYFDIIKFSDNPCDLSNATSVDSFLKMMGQIVDNAAPVLDKGRYLVLVIGDKYDKGEWIPLGFLAMNEVMKRDFLLKSIIVKNFDETTGKRNQKELWRYRALVGGFYIFKHEYIFVFKKR